MEQPLLEPQPSKMLTLAMLVLMTLSVTGYSIVAPFMPLQLTLKGFTSAQMGLVMGIYSLSSIVASPLMPRVIGLCGRRMPVFLGSAFLSTAFFGFAFIDLLEF